MEVSSHNSSFSIYVFILWIIRILENNTIISFFFIKKSITAEWKTNLDT